MPPSFLVALKTLLFGSAWDPVARFAWCRRQRRLLRAPGHAVIWIRGAAAPWAAWGERHGYFEIERMDGLPYLRAVARPIAST
jgi:hypothetical protein